VTRATILTLAGLTVVMFIIGSFLVARALTGAGDERARVLEVLKAQAAGDAEGVLAKLPACRAEPACVRGTELRVSKLRRPGRVEILRYEPSVQVALIVTRGTGRVAWRAGTGLPVVQCVRVRRAGPMAKDRVELIALSEPKDAESSC
jgi:hypothetical protein